MSFLSRLLGREEKTAARQEEDPHALDREGDPRGGVQSTEYRHADPREVVADESGTMMAGPGGAPQEGTTVDEQRDEDAPADPSTTPGND